MKKGKMEVRVGNLKLVAILVAILVTVLVAGMASARQCVDCHAGNSISTLGGGECLGRHDQKGRDLFLGKSGENLVGLAQAAGTTYYVPDNFATIQDAIDTTVDGDEIVVRDGTYEENIRFWGKAITVRSENGPATTIIQGVEGEYPDCGLAAVVTFWNNEGPNSVLDGFTVTNGQGGFGGGIASYASEPAISNCIFTGNTAMGWGGGIFLCDWSGGYAAATITNCIITNNNASGDSGGGIYCAATTPTIINCTISGNSANTGGGGIQSSSDVSPTVVNNILWGNTAGGIPDEISVGDGCSINITYSDIEGGWTGDGNIDCDPQFVGSGDYHLTECACCIDVGTSAGAPGYDIDGDPRPQGDGYDMGADEFPVPQTCLDCHSSDTSSTIEDGTPIVYYTGSSAPTEYLAGGNFWWVADDGGNLDNSGHNVLGIAGVDPNYSMAPGNAYNCSNSCHMSLAVEQTAWPALGSGCEGCHHNPHPEYPAWYRDLSGHMSGTGHGVEGIEDQDWEATSSSTDHNDYLGWVGDHGYQAGFYNLGNTMTGYCSGCHGDFHVEQDASGQWIRHASDAVIPNSGEFANAFGAGGSGTGTYDPLVPVARPNVPGSVSDSVTLGTDMVMCLSCHSAHGSPYSVGLRWDPADRSGGCVTCHTEKSSNHYDYEQDCTVCHSMHGNPGNDDLVKDDYPALPPNSYCVLNPDLAGASIWVMSLADDNVISTATNLNLNCNESGEISAVQGSVISGVEPFDLGSTKNGTDMAVPESFAGTEFVIPHIRYSHTYYILCPSGDATVDISLDGSTTQVTAVQGQGLSYDAGSDNTISGIITSDLPILVSHVAYSGTSPIDAFPVPPVAQDLWGVRSKNFLVGALEDDTAVSVYASDGSSTSVVLDAGDRKLISLGANTSEGQGSAIHLVSDKPVAAVQYADSDGTEATAFFDTTYLGVHYGIPVDAQYVAVVCPEDGSTVTLYDGANPPETLVSSGTPGKLYFGSSTDGVNISAGAYIESDKPIYLIYEASATNDEHNLLATSSKYYILNPDLAAASIWVMSLVDDNVISTATNLNLNCNESGEISAVQGSVIGGVEPFDIGSAQNATDMPVPGSFAGTDFVIPHIRNSHTYYILCPSGDAQAQIDLGGTVDMVTAPQGEVISVDAGSDNTISGIITSDLPILVSHVAYSGTSPRDAFPVPPVAQDLWGVRSKNILVGAPQDSTSLTLYASDGSSTSTTLNAGDRKLISLGANTSEGQGSAIHVVSDKPVAAVQYADSDGTEATAFFDTTYLGVHYGIPVDAQYVAVVCPEDSTTVTLYDGANPPETLVSSGTPGKLYFGSSTDGVNISAGAYIESDKPIYLIYEASATNDEHNLLGLAL